MQGLGIVSLSDIPRPGTDFRLAPHAAVLGLAVLLGFSERLFNKLGDQAEKVLGGDQASGSAAAAGSPTSPLGSVELGGQPAPSSNGSGDPHDLGGTFAAGGGKPGGGPGSSPDGEETT